MKKLFNKDIKYLFKNSSILFSGNVISTLLNLAILSIAAKKLGAGNFGQFVLAQSYVLVLIQLFSMQSWQVLIKFGTSLKNDVVAFRRFSIRLLSVDFGLAVLSIIVSLFLKGYFIKLFNVSDEINMVINIYTIFILFSITGTAIGILRVFDKYKILSIYPIFMGGLKLLLLLIFINNLTLTNFTYIWVISESLINIILIFISYIILIKGKTSNIDKDTTSNNELTTKQVITFAFSTSLNATIRNVTKQLDIIIVGFILGNINAGYYKIIKQFAAIFGKVSDPLYSVIFPQLTRLWNNKQYAQMKQLIVKSIFIMSIIGITLIVIMVILVEYIIVFSVGSEYLVIKNSLLIYLLANLIAIIFLALQPTILAIGKPNISLYSMIFSSIIYLLILFYGLPIMGLVGTGIAYILFYLIHISIQSIYVYFFLKNY
jgi:O-antigen/teichoic acid export membrane protein